METFFGKRSLLINHLNHFLNHSLATNHPITIENFKILASCDRFDLRLLESLFIQKLKPSLNDQHSSTDLLIVN